MTFTMDNTEGYTQEELDALNAELDERLEGVDDPLDQVEIEKRFADEVSRR